MSGLAAAHQLDLNPRELAMLCQKAENLVVGAPCGVMDQMASVLGQAGQLLALQCQPAEVQGQVPIPPQVGGGVACGGNKDWLVGPVRQHFVS